MEVVVIHPMEVMQDFQKIFSIEHFIFTIHLIFSINLCHILEWMMISVIDFSSLFDTDHSHQSI